MINRIVMFFSLITCTLSFKINACSTFILEKEDRFLLAKSYDWIVEDGLVIVNKRDIAKQAMTSDQPMQWVSKYGSLVFTQAGRELPMGGMNETGLAIELMWLDETIYPMPDSRSTVYELQWIQYQLDTASSLEEVLASHNILRIDRSSKSLIHFLVIDGSGNCAIIEFINGEMVVHARNEMLMPVLTNNTYQKSLEYLKEHQGFGGDKVPSEDLGSLSRFVRISTLLRGVPSENVNPHSAFKILSSVADFRETPQEEATFENMERLMRTKWNIVYDVVNKKIHFLTQSNRNVRTICLKAFDFAGDTAVQVLEMRAQLVEDVSHHFIPYTYELNRSLIDRYYNQVPFLKGLSEEVRELTARYPDTTYYIGR